MKFNLNSINFILSYLFFLPTIAKNTNIKQILKKDLPVGKGIFAGLVCFNFSDFRISKIWMVVNK